MRVKLGLSLAILLAACEPAGSYPLHGGPPNTWAHAPVAVGEPAWLTVLFVELRPGDEIELLAAEAIGVGSGAMTTFHASPPIIDPSGDIVIGEAREPLVGWTHAVPPEAAPTVSVETTFGILAEITAERPGRYVLESVRLTYRLNGGPEQTGEGIDTVFVVCADDPAPAECEDLESP